MTTFMSTEQYFANVLGMMVPSYISKEEGKFHDKKENTVNGLALHDEVQLNQKHIPPISTGVFARLNDDLDKSSGHILNTPEVKDFIAQVDTVRDYFHNERVKSNPIQVGPM